MGSPHLGLSVFLIFLSPLEFNCRGKYLDLTDTHKFANIAVLVETTTSGECLSCAYAYRVRGGGKQLEWFWSSMSGGTKAKVGAEGEICPDPGGDTSVAGLIAHIPSVCVCE